MSEREALGEEFLGQRQSRRKGSGGSEWGGQCISCGVAGCCDCTLFGHLCSVEGDFVLFFFSLFFYLFYQF